MSSWVELNASDGHRFDAWRSDPDGKPRGGIVFLHAIYGLTGHMGDVCDMFASAGYAAIAPALYDRGGKNRVFGYDPAGQQEGRTAYQALEHDGILADIAACAAALQSSGKVAISGFCTGGTWAWIAAARMDFDAQVNFYGSHVPQRLGYRPCCPTIMHYGDSDHVVPVPDIDKIRATHPNVTIYVYPGAGHAFFNPEQASHDADAAALAFTRSVEFLNSSFAP